MRGAILRLEMCARCGKMFIPGAEHLYKLIREGKTKYYCSYSCYRKSGGDGGIR